MKITVGMLSLRTSSLPLLLLFALASTSTLAAENNRFGHFGVGYTNLSGATNKSLGNPNTQLSLEFAAGKGGPFAAYLFKLRFDSSSGQSSFLDGGTAKSLKYTETAGNVGIGFRITPIPTPRETGILIYVGATIDLGLAQLRLPDQTYTSLTASQAAMTLGYDLFVGTDFILGGPKNPWGAFAEVALKQQSATLGGQSGFALGGLMLMGGIVW
jgi:hypothetical protein